MVYAQSLLKIIDNSGGVLALCIKVLGNSKLAKIGSVVIISVKTIFINKKLLYKKKKKILKGTVRKAVLVRSAYLIKRWGNIYLKGHDNAISILGNWDLPIASRIKGPVFFELRATKYIKTALLSEGVI